MFLGSLSSSCSRTKIITLLSAMRKWALNLFGFLATPRDTSRPLQDTFVLCLLILCSAILRGLNGSWGTIGTGLSRRTLTFYTKLTHIARFDPQVTLASCSSYFVSAKPQNILRSAKAIFALSCTMLISRPFFACDDKKYFTWTERIPGLVLRRNEWNMKKFAIGRPRQKSEKEEEKQNLWFSTNCFISSIFLFYFSGSSFHFM